MLLKQSHDPKVRRFLTRGLDHGTKPVSSPTGPAAERDGQ
jgi:hypothetical protein